jgi:hypothetical protein
LIQRDVVFQVGKRREVRLGRRSLDEGCHCDPWSAKTIPGSWAAASPAQNAEAIRRATASFDTAKARRIGTFLQ